MKRFLALAVALALFTVACGKKTPDASPAPSVAVQLKNENSVQSGLVGGVGDTVKYGAYNGQAITWQALAVDLAGNKTLLVAKDCVAVMAFNEEHNDPENTTWQTATVRAWLNGEFYDAAFDAGEKEKILETHITTPPNSESGAEDMSATVDRVFLLSEAECRQYFASGGAMAARYGGENVPWWTRTPGKDLSGRTSTYLAGGLYPVGYQVIVGDVVGVRPAMWVRIVDSPRGGDS